MVLGYIDDGSRVADLGSGTEAGAMKQRRLGMVGAGLAGLLVTLQAGVGPARAFSYGGPAVWAGGFNLPFGLAVDGHGNLFVGDEGHNAIVEFPAGSTVGHTVLSVPAPTYVGVDNADNLFFISGGATTVGELAVGQTTPTYFGPVFTEPVGLGVTPGGFIYIADQGANPPTVLEITPSHTTSVTTGFSSLGGIGVDEFGEVYVSDYKAGTVDEFVTGGTPKVVASGFVSPGPVTVDPAGSVFVADFTAKTISEFPDGGGAVTALPHFPVPNDPNFQVGSMAVDSNATLFFTDLGLNQLFYDTPGLQSYQDTITPTFGPPSSTITVNSVDPCPPPGIHPVTVSVSLDTAGAQVLTTTVVNANANGSWTAQLVVPANAPINGVGDRDNVWATCYDGIPSQLYLPDPFQVISPITGMKAFGATKSQAVFTASLTTSIGTPLVGRTIVFSTRNPIFGNQSRACSASTDSDGIATCTGRIPFLNRLFDTSYTASFAGGGGYDRSSAQASLT
jgi:hypothetical protein